MIPRQILLNLHQMVIKICPLWLKKIACRSGEPIMVYRCIYASLGFSDLTENPVSNVQLLTLTWNLKPNRQPLNSISLFLRTFPDSTVHGANMGPTWVLSAPDVVPCGLHEPCYQGRHACIPCHKLSIYNNDSTTLNLKFCEWKLIKFS